LDVVRSGKLGRVVSVDILRSSVYPPLGPGPVPPQYQGAGYPFRDLGVHALYVLEALLGPIENVRAEWKSLGGDPHLAFDEWRAQVRCRDGIGQFQLSWNVKPLQSQIIIQGTKGVLRVDLFLMFKARRASTPLPKAAERIVNALTDSLQPLVDVPRGVYGFLRKKVLPYHGLQNLVKEFYESLRLGQPVPVSLADAKRVVHWTEAVAREADREHLARVSAFQTTETVDYLVTGASGGLGSAIVTSLLARGKRVRALVRRPPDHLPAGMEVVIGDLGDPVAVDRAVSGARVVIHAGAAMKGGWPGHERATVVGTRNVLEACGKHRVGKLIHISSLSVVHWAGGEADEAITELSPLEPRSEERGHYTRAKLAAERLVTQYCLKRDIPALILRPGQIFGGRIPLMTAAIARRMGKHWIVLGNGNLRLPLIHIDDVVRAIEVAAECDSGEGQIVQLVHPEALTQNEVLTLALGTSAKVRRIPRAAIFALGGLSEVCLGLLRRKSPLSRYRLRSALSRRLFDGKHAHLLPGWRPTVDLRQAIAEQSEQPVVLESVRPAPLNRHARPTVSCAV
jgi:nucleoside-diphosphate-sugar epimerase